MIPRPKKILVVSSSYEFKERLDSILTRPAYNIINAHDIDMAIVSAREEIPDVILIDYRKSIMDDDSILGLYTYGGSVIDKKPILIFTDYYRPTHSVRNRPALVLGHEMLNRESLDKIISGSLEIA